MKIEDFAAAVGVAMVDFQGEVAISGSVSEPLSTYLRTEAFPLSAPPSLRAASDYGGLKIFAYQSQSVCVARFYDAGKKDRFQRAIASACVLVFPFALFRGGFRNLRMVGTFLGEVAASGLSSDTLNLLYSLYAEGNLAKDARDFVKVCHNRRVSYDLLASGIGLIAANHRLKVCSQDRSLGLSYFELLFALAPLAMFDSVAWCTYASIVSGSHEEVIVHDCQLTVPREETSWLGGMKGRLFGAKVPVEAGVDLQIGQASIPDRKDLRYRVTCSLMLELRDNSLRLPLDFEVRQAVIGSIIANIVRQSSPDLTLKALLPVELPTNETISPDVRSLLEGFLKEELAKKV